MRNVIVCFLVLFLSLESVDVSAQSFLKRIGKAFKTEIKNHVKKEVRNHVHKVKAKSQNEVLLKQQETLNKHETPKSSVAKLVANVGPITGELNGHKWVDLGLPSGTLWATCNLGSTKPELPGKLYAWGETATKKSYTEANSKYFGKFMSDISGQASNDAATAIWGTGWRIPTKEEFVELMDYCDWDCVQIGGRWVAKYTSRKNANYIYLPATGYMEGSAHLDKKGNGMYWTSTPLDDHPQAFLYMFGTEEGRIGFTVYCWGVAIRPVTDR